MSGHVCDVAPCDYYGTADYDACEEGLHWCSTSAGVWVSIDEHGVNSAVLPSDVDSEHVITAERAEAIAKALGQAAAILRDYRSPAQRIEQNVRWAFMGYDFPCNSVALREVLEVSVHRGRALWAGRAAYTSHELGVLAAYFDIDPARWTARDLRIPWPSRAQRRAARLEGDDRVVTYREEREHDFTEGIAA